MEVWGVGGASGLSIRHPLNPWTSALIPGPPESSEIAQRQPGWSIWRDGCPSSPEHDGETAEEMCARVDAVIAKVRKLHREAEDRGCSKHDDPNALSMKERRIAAEESDILIVSHGHFSRCFIA